MYLQNHFQASHDSAALVSVLWWTLHLGGLIINKRPLTFTFWLILAKNSDTVNSNRIISHTELMISVTSSWLHILNSDALPCGGFIITNWQIGVNIISSLTGAPQNHCDRNKQLIIVKSSTRCEIIPNISWHPHEAVHCVITPSLGLFTLNWTGKSLRKII